MAYVPTYVPTLRLVKNSELEWAELDNNFKLVVDEFGVIKAEADVLDARITTLEALAGISGVIPTVLSDLSDVATVTPVANQVLTWNGTEWSPADAIGKTVTVSFDSGSGNLTTTLSGSTAVVTNLDGRYARTVNGVAPDASGNIPISITATRTGTLAARPTTSTNGLVYVVSGDTAANNGKASIYVTGSGWFDITTVDAAANDARYVNVAGDTMTGTLILSGAPTVDLQASTKKYVDDAIAIEVTARIAGDALKQASDPTLTALAALDATTGIVVQTGADAFTKRTLTAGTGVTITNPAGIAGNPTIAVGGLTTAELSAATLVTAAETIAANNTDTTIPTSAAVKGYVDTAIAAAAAPASKVLLGTLSWTAKNGNVAQTLTGLNLAGYYGLEIGVNNVDLAIFTTAGGLIINGTNTGISSTGTVSARIEVSFTPSVMWIASTNSYVNHTITAATTTLSFASSQQTTAGGTVYVWGLR